MENSPAKIILTDVDVDDDVVLYFRSKRKSTANVVHDDDEMPRRRKGKKKEMPEPRRSRSTRKIMAEIDAWLEECDKLPPLWSDEEGDVDYSDAALVEVDGPRLKEADESEYKLVVEFASKCRQKCCLQLFRHPGDPRIGGLGSDTGKMLRDDQRDLAVIAFKLYQELNQNVKLQLRDLMKLNYGIGTGHYYMTFSAENEVTGEIKTYQAALANYSDKHLLGLFRDLVDDKILAILSVKGTEEDLAADEDEFWRMCEERRVRGGVDEDET